MPKLLAGVFEGVKASIGTSEKVSEVRGCEKGAGKYMLEGFRPSGHVREHSGIQNLIYEFVF